MGRHPDGRRPPADGRSGFCCRWCCRSRGSWRPAALVAGAVASRRQNGVRVAACKLSDSGGTAPPRDSWPASWCLRSRSRSVYMAPGSFPPVFYNIDTAYFLEKVHATGRSGTPTLRGLSEQRRRAVARTTTSTQAMAALISAQFRAAASPFAVPGRASASDRGRGGGGCRGGSVHQPGPASQRHRTAAAHLDAVTVELLLGHVWSAVVDCGNLAWILDRPDSRSVWPLGILSNEGPNVGGDFLILSSVAAIAAAPSWGWTLAAFLIGSAILVKTSVGIALVAGFALALDIRRLP